MLPAALRGYLQSSLNSIWHAVADSDGPYAPRRLEPSHEESRTHAERAAAV